MKCPHCEKEIDQVIVVSECYQTGYLDDKDPPNIVDYTEITEIQQTLAHECPLCGEKLLNIKVT